MSVCSGAVLRKQMRHETWCLCIRECLRIAGDFTVLPADLQRLSVFEQKIDRNCSRSLAAFGGKSGPRSI